MWICQLHSPAFGTLLWKSSDYLHTVSVQSHFTLCAHLCLLYYQCVHPRFLTLKPSVSGGFLWWLWLPKCWSSRERWRLRELAGDRNSVWTPTLAEEWKSGLKSSVQERGWNMNSFLISRLITVLTSSMSYLLQECRGIWIMSCKYSFIIHCHIVAKVRW